MVLEYHWFISVYMYIEHDWWLTKNVSIFLIHQFITRGSLADRNVSNQSYVPQVYGLKLICVDLHSVQQYSHQGIYNQIDPISVNPRFHVRLSVLRAVFLSPVERLCSTT